MLGCNVLWCLCSKVFLSWPLSESSFWGTGGLLHLKEFQAAGPWLQVKDMGTQEETQDPQLVSLLPHFPVLSDI